MSTLWTPGGEHPIPRPADDGPGDGDRPAGRPGGEGPSGLGTSPPSRREGGPPPAGGREEGAGREPSAEEIRQAQEEMEAVRQELLAAPAELVIANTAMSLWELGALHLSERPPHLQEAQLAIDALSALVEGLAGRLGEAERTLRDGLAQIRMGFVQVSNAERARQPGGGAAP